MLRRSTDYIVLHCSATPPAHDIGAAEIRQWHMARGWNNIGYHFVVRRNGAIETGRPAAEIGSHVKYHNANSLGVCLVGGVDKGQKPQNNFTEAQWLALKQLLAELQLRYPRALVIGHRDFPGVAKACPCFGAIEWAQANGLRAATPMRLVTASMLRAIKRESEDGDEADDNTSEHGTAPAKWWTAILGSGGVGSLAGLGYGLDWLSITAVILGLVLLVCLALYLMGYERREHLWDRLVGL